MNNSLRGLIASNYERMKMGREGALYHDWLYRRSIGQTKEIKSWNTLLKRQVLCQQQIQFAHPILSDPTKPEAKDRT